MYLALAAYHMGPTRLRKAQRQYPKLSSRDLVAKVAPASTVRYCRTVLKGRDLKLSVTEAER